MATTTTSRTVVTEARLRRLVRLWAGRLGLADWDLHVEIGEPDVEAASAGVFRSKVYQQATMRFQPWLVGQGEPPDDDWPGKPWDEERTEVAIVHELLHLQARDLREVALPDCFDGLVARDALRVWEENVIRAEEQLVDRLAWALVRAWRA